MNGFKVLRPALLKELIGQIIKDDAKVGMIIGSLMVGMVHYAYKIGGKNFMLTNDNVLCELAETIRIGSNITQGKAKVILYAIIGWLAFQNEKEIQLQDDNQHTAGIFEIEKGNISFKARALKS